MGQKAHKLISGGRWQYSEFYFLSAKLHPALWLGHLDEANSSVELVGVSSAQYKKSNTPNFRMIDRRLYDEFAKSLASERFIDKYVAEPPEGGPGSDPPGEANLRASWCKASQRDRALYRFGHNFNGAPLGPVALFAKPAMDQG